MQNMLFDTWVSFMLPQARQGPSSHAASSSRARHHGNFVPGRFDAEGGSLQFKLFIPSSYAGQAIPLMMMLHGCGQDADDFAVGTGMNELAERHGFLVAYPEQACEANWNRCWNWFDGAHHRRGQGEPDLLAGLARNIMTNYAVDKTRVCAAGLSSGGAMAVILGRTYPDIFTAVACHSGLAHGSAVDSFGALMAMRDGAAMSALAEECMQHASVPIIVFHGDMDTTVNIQNSTTVVQQTIASHTMHQLQEHEYVAMSEEKGQTTGRVYTRKVHTDSRGKILAEQWTVHGTGHAWSGGSQHGSYTDTRGPDASEEIVRFFIQA